MPLLITMTGPSQSGKSTAIKMLLECSDEEFIPISVPKYSTRKPRPDDKDSEIITCDNLPEDVDLVYQQYNVRYGLRLFDVIELMKQGKSPVVVLNDVRVINEVKRIFGDLVRSIFVYRKAPRREDFFNVAESRSGDVTDQDIDIRLKKAEAIYRIYIENIYLFDHVLINTQGLDELRLQIDAISGGSARMSLKTLANVE